MSRPAVGVRPRVVTLTEAGTGAAHLVIDEAMTAGLRSGLYSAVCGARVLPASFDHSGQWVVPGVRPVVVMSLSPVLERIALRRVSEGRIAMLQGSYFDHGRRVPDYLPAVLESLLERELAVLTDAGVDLWRRVALTPAGHAYHETLCAQDAHHPDPPPGRPPFRVGADPAGHRDCPRGVQPGPAPDPTGAAPPPQIPTVY